MDRSYYSLLGVSPDATVEEIKAAYRDCLKETHPDVSDSADASERTQRLIAAKAVLTDPQERERYDRLGHAAYVGLDETAATEVQNPSNSSTETSAQTDQHQAKQNQTTNQVNGKQATARTHTDFTDWHSRTDNHVGTPQWTDSETDEWDAWSVNGSYAVQRSDDTFQSILFSSKSLVLLAATFLVYPALLFGALFPAFPLPVRFLIGLCAVFVVAFLQSIPEVGILVFGTWSVVLPVILVTSSIPLISPVGLTVLLAVLFPLGLSALTRLVIRPIRV